MINPEIAQTLEKTKFPVNFAIGFGGTSLRLV